MSDYRYEKYHRKKETPEFVEWWVGYYGNPEDYQDTADERLEYWVRRAFALAGFLAEGGKNEKKQAVKEGS